MRSYPVYKEIGKSNVEELDNVRMATVLICSGFAVNERYTMASLICSASVSIFIVLHLLRH